MGAHWHPSSLSTAFCWPSPGSFSFSPSSRTDFYPCFSGSREYRLSLFLWGCSACAHTRCTTRRTCRTHVCTVALAHVLGSVYTNGCALPLRTCRWWGSARGEVCEGAQKLPGIPVGKKSLHPLARCHSPERAEGVRLASPGRGAQKRTLT